MKIKHILILMLLALTGETICLEVIDIDLFRHRALQNSEDVTIAEKKIEQSVYKKKEQFSNYFPKLAASGSYLHLADKINRSTDEMYLPTSNFNPTSGQLEPNLLLDADGKPIYDASGNPVLNSYAFIPAQDFSLNLRNVFQYGISLEQPIFLGGKIISANQMAAIGEKISTIDLKEKHQQILLDADMKYWRYVAVSEQVKVARAYVQLVDSLLTQVTGAVEAGLAHRNQLLKVQVKRNQASLKLEQAQNGQELLRMALCQMMGMDLDKQLLVSDSLVQITSHDLQKMHKGTPQKRADYQMLEQVIDLKKSNVDLVRSDFLPQIGLKASYSFLEGIKLNNNEILNVNGSASVMLSVNVPIFRWGEGYHKVKAAKMEEAIAVHSLQKYKKMMTLEIEQAFLNVKEAYSRYYSSKSNLEQANENLELSRDGYEVGLELLTDYLEAQAQWQSAYADFIDASVDCKIKESIHRKATGQL